MPIKAHLPHKTSKDRHIIRKFVSETLFKASQIISQNRNSTLPNPEKLLPFKPNSQFFGTSFAKPQNTKLIGHKTSFPKQQAPSSNSQNQKSYAQNNRTAVQEKLDSALIFHFQIINTHSTTKSTHQQQQQPQEQHQQQQ